jgi:hypothetical protein
MFLSMTRGAGETHRQLREQLQVFPNAYSSATRLKTFRGLTPYEHICKARAKSATPIQIRSNPPHIGTEHLVVRASTYKVRSACLLACAEDLFNCLHNRKFEILLLITEVLQFAQIRFEGL